MIDYNYIINLEPHEEDIDSEFPVKVTQKVVKARKNYQCDECGEIIKKNMKYGYYSGLYLADIEGNRRSFLTFRTCMDCLSLREEFFEFFRLMSIWEDFELFLSDWIDDDEDDFYEENSDFFTKVNRLTPKAKKKVELILNKLKIKEENFYRK
jgi:hypothetical protein